MAPTALHVYMSEHWNHWDTKIYIYNVLLFPKLSKKKKIPGVKSQWRTNKETIAIFNWHFMKSAIYTGSLKIRPRIKLKKREKSWFGFALL